MVIRKQVTIGGQDYAKTWSDLSVYIQKCGTDETYEVAYDPVQYSLGRIYVETDIPIRTYDY